MPGTTSMKPEYWMVTEGGAVVNVVTSPETHKIINNRLCRVMYGLPMSWIPMETLHETKEAAMVAQMNGLMAEIERLQKPVSPLRDIHQEIMDFRETNPTHGQMEKFILERVQTHPKQATEALLDYYRQGTNGL